jgi:hypothetical protein
VQTARPTDPVLPPDTPVVEQEKAKEQRSAAEARDCSHAPSDASFPTRENR